MKRPILGLRTAEGTKYKVRDRNLKPLHGRLMCKPKGNVNKPRNNLRVHELRGIQHVLSARDVDLEAEISGVLEKHLSPIGETFDRLC